LSQVPSLVRPKLKRLCNLDATCSPIFSIDIFHFRVLLSTSISFWKGIVLLGFFFDTCGGASAGEMVV
jgi:hypothetical protein